MLCVEGRRSDSLGCSLEVCRDILLRHNAITAMNCDGGTTAILWYRGNPIIRCSNSAIPNGRYLPNAWVITGN
jgi:exopolysaccharide biosynthesis protein